MEEEEDDFYAPNGDASMEDDKDGVAGSIKQEQDTNGHMGGQMDQDREALEGQDEDDGDEDDDDDDDDDDDSDIDIITERQDGAAPESTSQTRTFRGIKPEPPRTASVDPAASATPRPNQQLQSQQQSQSLPSSKSDPAVAQSNKVSLSLQDGSKYPEVRSSTIDVDSVPVWNPAGKPITEVDIDADLAEHTKPWRLPGTDQTDFFNYGFDEFTWTQYCFRQQTMSSAIDAQKQETKQLEMMLAGQPAPAGPGAQPVMPMGMPGMPPMPDMNPEMMNAMMASMSAQGLSDPSQLDFGAFMQQMQSMGSMPPMPGQAGFAGQNMQHQNSNQGYHGQQQSGQSYGGGTPQGQSQGQQAGMEGYSAQQLAMLGAGGPPQGPAGQRGRGRGRRW